MSGPVALLAVAVGLVVLAQGAGAAEGVQLNVTTDAAIELGGPTATEDGRGILVSPWEGEPAAQLSARQVHVVTEWEEGRLVQEGPVKYRHVEADGTEHRNLTDVRGDLAPWEGDSVLFAEPSGGNATVSGEGLGGTSLRAVAPGQPLAWGGYADADADANQQDLPGYGYRAQRALVDHADLRRATVSGSFTLFVHNVTLALEHGDGERWEDRTGYHEEEQTGPGKSYELRVTRLHVTDGELHVTDQAGVSVLGPRLATSVDGSLDVPRADGLLDASSEEILLRGAPLELSGSGQVSVAATEAGDETPLTVEGQGSFQVLSPEDRLATAATAAGSGPGAEASWLPLVLVGTVLAIAVGGAVSRKPGLLRPLPAALRDRLFWRWLRRGQAEEDERAYGRAERFYRRSTAVRPAKPAGWYHRAKARLEAGEPEEALGIIARAEDETDAVPLDLLELEVAAAWRAGQEAPAKRALIELAEQAPAMAEGLVEDLSLDELRTDPEVRDVLGERREPGGLEGYV